MCDATAIYYAVSAVVAVAGGLSSHEASRKSASMQQDAVDQGNRDRNVAPPPGVQNSKTPDERARRAAAYPTGGPPSGTMLTSPSGIADGLLNLGKNTLLGQ